MTYSATWRPPLTHLVRDDGDGTRTLCGAQLSPEWHVEIFEIGVDELEDETACGCRRCAAIAKREPQA